ncbi:hypothetical protein FB451DRAFT_1184986 [Mycena latifolia]|nr:hypothetical protein FB451DRAFT_1184986 [Mycena latifolia]
MTLCPEALIHYSPYSALSQPDLLIRRKRYNPHGVIVRLLGELRCSQTVRGSPMTTIPQELVEAILRDFDPAADRVSLKSISLIATNFTHLVAPWTQYAHLVPELRAGAGSPLVLPAPRSVRQGADYILRLCPNVRRFVVKGAGVRWGTLKPGLQSALAARISTPGLDALYLISLFDVPVSVIYGAARHIPLLSARHVSFEKSGAVPASADASESQLTHLILALNLWNVFTMLQRGTPRRAAPAATTVTHPPAPRVGDILGAP